MKARTKKFLKDFLDGKDEGYVSPQDLEIWYQEADAAGMDAEETEFYIKEKIKQEFKSAERRSKVLFISKTILLFLISKLVADFLCTKLNKKNPAN